MKTMEQYTVDDAKERLRNIDNREDLEKIIINEFFKVLFSAAGKTVVKDAGYNFYNVKNKTFK